MALLSYITSQAWYKKFFSRSGSMKYFFLIGLLLVGVLIFGYGYKKIMGNRTAQSQQQLAECLALFDATAAQASPDWHALGETLKNIYAEQSNLVTSPMLSLLADVYVHEGDLAKAIQTMDLVLKSLSPSSPLYSLYKIKHALMCLDSLDNKLVEDGLAQLTMMAQDKMINAWDEAAYYVGLYYWEKNDIKQASLHWQDLRDMPLDIEGASPWAARVQAKLPLV